MVKIHVTNLSYFHRKDFSAYQQDFVKMTQTGVIDEKRLAEIINEVVKDTWTVEPGRYSVGGIKMPKVGGGIIPNLPGYPTYAAYDSVFVLELSEACTAFKGRIYLTFNKE